MQLMQSKVQKSTSTTLPRSCCWVSGALLCHWLMPLNSGAAAGAVAALTPLENTPLAARPAPANTEMSRAFLNMI